MVALISSLALREKAREFEKDGFEIILFDSVRKLFVAKKGCIHDFVMMTDDGSFREHELVSNGSIVFDSRKGPYVFLSVDFTGSRSIDKGFVLADTGFHVHRELEFPVLFTDDILVDDEFVPLTVRIPLERFFTFLGEIKTEYPLFEEKTLIRLKILRKTKEGMFVRNVDFPLLPPAISRIVERRFLSSFKDKASRNRRETGQSPNS